MAGLVRLTTTWTGFPGSPGYTNLYCQGGVDNLAVAQAFADLIKAWWEAVKPYLPSAAILTVGPIWDALEDSTGALEDQGSLTTPPAATTGGNGTTYPGNVGFAVNWGTAVFINGHRLKGRTYVVPAVACFQNDGTMDPAIRLTLMAAALDLTEGTVVPVVWHRPVNGAGGSSSPITSAVITDRASILRSRSV